MSLFTTTHRLYCRNCFSRSTILCTGHRLLCKVLCCWAPCIASCARLCFWWTCCQSLLPHGFTCTCLYTTCKAPDATRLLAIACKMTASTWHCTLMCSDSGTVQKSMQDTGRHKGCLLIIACGMQGATVQCAAHRRGGDSHAAGLPAPALGGQPCHDLSARHLPLSLPLDPPPPTVSLPSLARHRELVLHVTAIGLNLIVARLPRELMFAYWSQPFHGVGYCMPCSLHDMRLHIWCLLLLSLALAWLLAP